MKRLPHRQPILVTALQATCVVVLAACALLLSSEHLSNAVDAQGCSTPPSGTIGGGAWARDKPIQIRVDSKYPESDRKALESGTIKWHGGNCSGVTFHGFQSLDMPDYDAVPPNFHLWFQKDDPKNGFNAHAVKTTGPQEIGAAEVANRN